jgi:transposase
MRMMPRAFPKEYPKDDFKIVLGREWSIARVAQDFGISESCVQHWVNFA